jgi:nitrate/TMAO reductase-like tetraheme cytochrome c subunit
MIRFSRLKNCGCRWEVFFLVIPITAFLFWSFPVISSAQESSCASCHASAEQLGEMAKTVAAAKGKVAQPGSYKKWLVDAEFLDEDPHGSDLSCVECHGGNPEGENWEERHAELKKDPTYPDPQSCGDCHEEIVEGDESTPHINLSQFKENANVSCGQCHVSRPTSQGGGLIEGHMFSRKPSEMNSWFRHEWLNEEKLHLARVECQTCHSLSLESAVKDCGQCHSKNSILVTKTDAASTCSLKNWSFTNKELMAKGGFVIGSNRIPALDSIGILIVILTFVGCFIHGALRFITRRRKE